MRFMAIFKFAWSSSILFLHSARCFSVIPAPSCEGWSVYDRLVSLNDGEALCAAIGYSAAKCSGILQLACSERAPSEPLIAALSVKVEGARALFSPRGFGEKIAAFLGIPVAAVSATVRQMRNGYTMDTTLYQEHYGQGTCCWGQLGDLVCCGSSSCIGYAPAGKSGSCSNDWSQDCEIDSQCPFIPVPLCTCDTPGAGWDGQNGYTCTDKSTGYCASTEKCAATVPFEKDDWKSGCTEVTSCTCDHPNSDYCDENGYTCTDKTTGYCSLGMLCSAHEAFEKDATIGSNCYGQTVCDTSCIVNMHPIIGANGKELSCQHKK